MLNIIKELSVEEKIIFDNIQKKGPMTKNDIAALTGYKLTTLIRFMKHLEKLGLITVAHIGESTGGRKPLLYDISINKFYLIGIDISRLYTQVVITNLKMEILMKQKVKMDLNSTPEIIIKFIETTVQCFMKKLNITKKMLLGAGVGTVGPLNRENGVMINPDHFIAPGWINVPLKEQLEEKLGCRIIIDNGANAALLAETYFGIGKKFKNIIYLNCGVGIRTSAISSGKLIRSMNDAEDVFGHMVIDVHGEKCSCGNYGCIECYSTIFSLTSKVVSEIEKGNVTTIKKPLNQMNYRDICEAAGNNDVFIKKILEDSAVILGIGLANLINLLNPGLVILSGQLIKHSTLFYTTCVEAAANRNYLNKSNKIIFSRGGYLEGNAISIGSAAVVIEYALESQMMN